MDQIEKLSLKLSEDFAKCSNPEERCNLLMNYLQNLERNSNVLLPWPEDNTWINVSPMQADDVLGKVVLLDFFTYCCINCIHIMPFLHKIEKQFTCNDGLVVIGIHSAKFPNEKVSDNILKALQRYNLTHPVVNDFNLELWNGLSIKCWPTLVLVSPRGKILLSLPGEAHLEVVESLLSEALRFYKDCLSQHDIVSLPKNLNLDLSTELRFPGKVAIDKTGNRLAIADTGNNRVILCDREGRVFHVVGSGLVGKQDGGFETCSFNSPQGVTWHRSDTVFVADCDNHLIRKIDLVVDVVVTVAGTGEQGNDYEGGEFGTDQVLSSPWDAVVAGSPRFPEAESILYIAMSGIHQIWAFFLQDADWQKGSEYVMGTCMRMAGSGQEENRNNSYPHKAGFAQPSGLAVDVLSHKLYVADSESSTIRRVSLANGAVEAVVGGHFDPTNLFAFGDADGKARNARLQHPLAVAWDRKREILYVADSYNHKIKIVNPATKIAATLCGPEECKVEEAASLNLAAVFSVVNFNEPGGLCLDPQCEQLYIADTNNHDVKILTLATGECCQLQLKFPCNEDVTDSVPAPKLQYHELVSRKNAVFHQHDGVLVGRNSALELSFRAEAIHLTSESPSSWQLSAVLMGDESSHLSDSKGQVLVNSGEFHTQDAALSLSLPVDELCKLLLMEQAKGDSLSQNAVRINIIWEAIMYYCPVNAQLCLMRQTYALIPLEVDLIDASEKPINLDIVIELLK